MIDEMISKLLELKKELLAEATNEKIQQLESALRYYEKKSKQDEIKIIRLETRIAEIHNLLNGQNDKV